MGASASSRVTDPLFSSTLEGINGDTSDHDYQVRVFGGHSVKSLEEFGVGSFQENYMPVESGISESVMQSWSGYSQSTSISLSPDTSPWLREQDSADLLHSDILDTYTLDQIFKHSCTDSSGSSDINNESSISIFSEAGLSKEIEISSSSDSQSSVDLSLNACQPSILVIDESRSEVLPEHSSQLPVDRCKNIPDAMKSNSNKRAFSSCHIEIPGNKFKQNPSVHAEEGKLLASTGLTEITLYSPEQKETVGEKISEKKDIAESERLGLFRKSGVSYYSASKSIGHFINRINRGEKVANSTNTTSENIKRKRVPFGTDQIKILKDEYKNGQKVGDDKGCERIAKRTDLDVQQVKNWLDDQKKGRKINKNSTRCRMVFSEGQIAILEEEYKKHQKNDSSNYNRIAEITSLKYKQVYQWFGDRRRKDEKSSGKKHKLD